MDRNEVLEISRAVTFGRLTDHDISKLLIEYCVVEHNKPIESTNMLISILLQHRMLLPLYIQEAVEYYERKFNICKLYSAHNLLDGMGQRKLLQIF